MSSGTSGVLRRKITSKDQEEIDKLLDSFRNESGEIDNKLFKKVMSVKTSKVQEELLNKSNKILAKSPKYGDGKKSKRRKSKRKKTRRKSKKKKTRRRRR